MNARTIIAASLGAGIAASAVFAQVRDVILPASFVFNGKEQTITQSQTIDTVRVSQHYQRPINCGGVCIAPMRISPLIETIAEPEVISFVASEVAGGRGLLLDSRTPADRATGFIPGSINVPVALLEPDNPFLPDILVAMGAAQTDSGMNFANALPLVVYDDGPTTEDAPDLIAALQAAGYPADKIRYYRGGLQIWSALGLTIQDA